MSSKGFNLIGYASSPMGLGEDLRSFAALLVILKIPFSVIDLPTDSSNILKNNWGTQTQKIYPISIFFTSPIEFNLLNQKYPNLFTLGKFKIGYFLWELPDFPERHANALSMVDHIWCPTSFVQESFIKTIKKVILAIPLPVISPPMSGYDFRKALGVPGESFVSLYMFDMHSTVNRKNPHGVIKAFIEFSTNNPDAYLFLKLNRAKSSQLEDLGYIKDCRNIKVINQILTPNQISDLYQSADCYLSLHRSEGFGRTLVEALRNGLYVISTNFSGPNDFLNHQNSLLIQWEKTIVNQDDYPHCDTSWWSEPSVIDASIKLEAAQNLSTEGRNLKGQEMAKKYEPEYLAEKYKGIIQHYLDTFS
ncbi:glycosyltransferase [Polynucleobacter sp. Latsch14-2]|uniref:glycosyltransferase n=1 Tax=Polynucleobacter sp. Latsch14-2 TaxID=2576920 RepID=UPI001C0BB4EF|nr:glycosyltransferase [Polynucleobacter sp. Latsch14-2]MBU3615544.1 glycosyltransferase [Polynucleobacter sp. Latsch14-2]